VSIAVVAESARESRPVGDRERHADTIISSMAGSVSLPSHDRIGVAR
jgi:hypothetical protein